MGLVPMMEGNQDPLIMSSNCCSLSELVNETNKTSEEQSVWYRYSFYVSGTLVAAYGLVFVAGLVGNSLVVLTVLRGTRRMRRSITNIFLVNLAVADLLVILACIPFTLVTHLLYPWVLGWIICKLVPYLQGVSVCASVWTLVAVAVERHRSLSSPWKRRLTSRRYRSVIALIWVLSFIITIPWLFVFNQFTIDGVLVCRESWPDPIMDKVYFGVAHLTLCYILPLTIIAVCYAMICKMIWCREIPGDPTNVHHQPSASSALSGKLTSASRQIHLPIMLQRSRLRALRMLAIVVVGFALAWLPLYVTFARLKFFAESISEEEAQMWEVVIPIAQWMGSAHSCINPVFYHFLDPRFRAGFRKLLICSTAAGRVPSTSLAAARYRLPPLIIINLSQPDNTNSRKSTSSLYHQEMNVCGISNQIHGRQDDETPIDGTFGQLQHKVEVWI